MKRVFSNSDDVIHLFAQKTQNEARCQNVFFEGKRLYSYGRHYLLAEFIDEKTVYINDVGYSVTTSKHIRQAEWALSQYKQFKSMSCDIDNVYRQIMSDKDKLSNARKPEMYINSILSLWSSLNEYLSYTKKVNIKHSDKYKELKRIVNLVNKDPEQYQEKLKAFAIKEAKRKKKEAEKRKKEALSKFFNYKIDSFRIDGVNDFLRISQDKKFIETSQNVRVSIPEAKKLYTLIKAGKDIKGYTIEHYTVISINGTLKIGCHNIDTTNAKEIGEKILTL